MLKIIPNMACRILPAIALVSIASPLRADAPVTAGGWTQEACTGLGGNTALVVTASSAYTAGNEVGPPLTLTFARRNAPNNTGILQSVTLDSKSVQTAEFDVSFLIKAPTSPAVFVDKTTPAIAAADVFSVRGPVKLTNNFSGLGTHTVYNTDQIARATALQPTEPNYTITAIITTPGTPTFTSTTDLQLCIGILQD
jgi:hypothetical protein